MLSAWRLQTRGHAQQVKVARKAEKFFVQRAGWKRWAERVAARKREGKVREFETRLAGKYLRGMWFPFAFGPARGMAADELVAKNGTSGHRASGRGRLSGTSSKAASISYVLLLRQSIFLVLK